jgi:hypothetical protein
LNRPELIQEHLLKFQNVIRAAASRFCLKSFQHTTSLNCFPLHGLPDTPHANQDSVFMFGSGRPVPKASVHLPECDVIAITNQPSPVIYTHVSERVSQVPAAALKIPVFTKPLIAPKRNITSVDEVSATVKKPKKQDPEKSKKVVTSVLTKAVKDGNTSIAATNTTFGDSLERLLLEAGVCWSTFASFMSVHSDATTILQPLQVAQLKQIVKMNPKGSKVSGTKNELIERIVAMLKAA